MVSRTSRHSVTPSRDTPRDTSRDAPASPGTKQTPKQYVAPIPMYFIGTHANVVPPPSKGDTNADP
jgi:hypothetical protein